MLPMESPCCSKQLIIYREEEEALQQFDIPLFVNERMVNILWHLG